MAAMKRPAKRPSRTGKTQTKPLSARDRNFCHRYMEGMSAKEAYAEAGFSPKFTGGTTALMKRPNVKAYLDKLRAIQRIRLNVTMDSLVLELRRAMDFARATENAGAYVAAIMGLAKLTGFLVERSEHEIHLIPKPALRPGTDVLLSPEEWARQWSPREIEHKPNGHGNGEA